MNPDFKKTVDALHPLFMQLKESRPVEIAKFSTKPKRAGVYLFSEVETGPLYVGRSNDIRGRFGRHCNPGATHRQAPFAFKLAREETGRVIASYMADENSRDALIRDPVFLQAFTDAKYRIRAMEFRYVVEADPVRQCLLEVYCAVSLKTPYNDFDNH